MTSTELRDKFNREFGLDSWPESYIVDWATYGSCCQAVFDNTGRRMITPPIAIPVTIGRHGNLMFKNVELIPR